MSTDLPSADSKLPSTSSDTVAAESGGDSLDTVEGWLDSGGVVVPCSADMSSEVALGAVVNWVVVVMERLSEVVGVGTLSGKDEQGTPGVELITEDSEIGSSVPADLTSEEHFECADLTDFSLSTAVALFVVLLLARAEPTPDDVVLVTFEVVEATAVHAWAPCEPVAGRVVV